MIRELLAMLYRYGPSLHGYGFWGGMELSSICALVTGVGTHHWLLNEDACKEIYTHHEDAFVIAVTAAICVFVLINMLCAVWVWFFSMLFYRRSHNHHECCPNHPTYSPRTSRRPSTRAFPDLDTQ